MSDLHCPGRTSPSAYLSSVVVPCPGCGHQVEIFGDEIRVHCRCGQYVFREALPACAKWCKEAARCFGIAGNLPQSLQDSCGSEDLKKQEERFRELQGRVIAALAKCAHPEVAKDGI